MKGDSTASLGCLLLLSTLASVSIQDPTRYTGPVVARALARGFSDVCRKHAIVFLSRPACGRLFEEARASFRVVQVHWHQTRECWCWCCSVLPSVHFFLRSRVQSSSLTSPATFLSSRKKNLAGRQRQSYDSVQVQPSQSQGKGTIHEAQGLAEP